MNSDERERRGSALTFKERQRNQARARFAWLTNLRKGAPGRRHGVRQ